MGKSSSSLKKKRSKKSSKVRSKKISKSSTRKSKSKKLRRKDSISGSSDDDSRSSFSVSSYSSEDETRSRRARSRTRKDVKSGKKRARKRSSSRDSSEDSHRVKKKKKKKGVKKSSGTRGRKRTHEKKKKARRDASVSSVSSGSRCDSGCRYGHGSSGESEYESKKESNEPNVDKIQTERYRSIDHPALYDQSTESIDHWIQEKDMGENNNNPRRLRSVIIVIKQEDEGRELDNKEQPKEEIVCDHDDYPSSRSNDSNDGGNKGESDNNTSFDSEKKLKAEVEKKGAGVSNNPCNEARDATGDPGEEDLETVLRLRALENLKKFRGKGLRDNKTGKQTISVEVEPFQNKPVEESDARGVKTTELVEKRDSARSLRIDEKRLYQNDDCNQSGSPHRVAVANNLQKKVSQADDSVMDKPKLGAAALRRQNSTKPQTTSKQASASQKACETPVSSKDKISAVDGQDMARTITEGGEGVNPNAHGSTTTMEPPSLKSPAEATISEEPQDEAKETSQYEQKTMSVMRGGEMVQVSYKVYIPKKTPALARRQLKR